MKQQTLPGQKHASHSNLGRNFEAMLERTHHFYLVRGWAKVVQNPNEWKYDGEKKADFLKQTGQFESFARTGGGRFIVRKKSDVDFSGVAYGRHIEFDAKQTKEASFALAQVEPHQVEKLLQTERCGGIAGLMIFLSEKQRVFFVPARVVDAAITEMLHKRGRKSLSLKLMETDGVEIPLRNNLVDWLPVLLNGNKTEDENAQKEK